MAKLGKRKLYALAVKILQEKESLEPGYLSDMKICEYSKSLPLEYIILPKENMKYVFTSNFGGERVKYSIYKDRSCMKFSGWFEGVVPVSDW